MNVVDTRYLEYILTLAETRNMTKAAKKLFISQPTLSQFLSKQELELGAPLFQRANGEYTLTPLGSLYAEYAKKVLALTRTLEKDMKRISTSSRIRMGTSSNRSMEMLTTILVDFRKYYPNVELIMSDGNLRNLTTAIANGEMDIALATAHSLDQYKGQSMELKKEEVVFAVPAAYCNQKYSPGRISSLTSQQALEAFGDHPFILQHKGSCIRNLIDGFFSNQDFNPIIACTTSHALSICDMVSNNVGMGFIPTGYAISSPRIVYFSLKPKLHRIHSVIYRKDLILETPHKLLIELAKKYAEDNWRMF